MKVTQPCLTLGTLWTIAHQSPLSMEFSRREYWSGWPLPSPGIEPRSPALQVDSLLSEPLGKRPNLNSNKMALWLNSILQPAGHPGPTCLLFFFSPPAFYFRFILDFCLPTQLFPLPTTKFFSSLARQAGRWERQAQAFASSSPFFDAKRGSTIILTCTILFASTESNS